MHKPHACSVPRVKHLVWRRKEDGLNVPPNVIVGPIRHLAGAAGSYSTGDEATLVAHFVRLRDSSLRRRIFMTEVPLPGGVADLVELRLRSPYAPTDELASHEVAALAPLEDRFLYTLASMRRDVGYSRAHKKVASLTDSALTALMTAGLLHETGSLLMRVALLPDRVATVDIYEFKSRVDGRALQQAARRKALGTRVWVASDDAHLTGETLRDRAKVLGVGIVDARSGRIALRPSQTPGLASWARFELARQAARGLYGGPSEKSV